MHLEKENGRRRELGRQSGSGDICSSPFLGVTVGEMEEGNWEEEKSQSGSGDAPCFSRRELGRQSGSRDVSLA